jgi:hypothetical protein
LQPKKVLRKVSSHQTPPMISSLLAGPRYVVDLCA